MKAKAAASLFLGAALAFVVPLIPFLLMIFALVALDFFTGVRAAKARKEAITSGGMKRTIEKTSLYFAAILLSEGMVQVFFPSLPVTYIVATYIALTEFKSNIENIGTATGTDIWKSILSKIGLFKMIRTKAATATKEKAVEAPKGDDDKK